MSEIFTYGTLNEAKYRIVLTGLGMEYLYPKLFTNYSNQLGTPVADIITIADSLAKPNYIIQLDTAIIDANAGNIIKETNVQGRRGRVKEYIAEDDWNITIRGGIFSGNKDSYPEEAINILRNLKRVAEVEVTSEYLRILNVRSLVIKNLSFPPTIGKMNYQIFEIQCVSEIPYELEVVENV